jgi:uncharacterized membrane protein YdjX (TVP38/TMEM64 family)
VRSRLIHAARHHRRLIRAALVILLLLAVALSLRYLPVDQLVRWLDQQAEALGHWTPVVFLLLFVSLAAVWLPAWPLNVAAGVIFGPVLGALMTCLASNSAAAFTFFIGRRLARRQALRIVRRYPKLDAVYHSLGSARSWKLVAAVRLSHALPFGLQNFLLGASPVRFWTFLLTTIAVTLPGICVIAYLGYLGAMAVEVSEAERSVSPLEWAMRVGGVAIAVAALYYLSYAVLRAIKERAHIDVEEDDEE